MSRLVEILLVFLRLGLTTFGGPVAHLLYFRHELVESRRWLAEEAYADLMAVLAAFGSWCWWLPGSAFPGPSWLTPQPRGKL